MTATRDLRRRVRQLQRQLGPDVPDAKAVDAIPPEITELIGRVVAAWRRRIVEGIPPNLEHASTRDLIVAAASYFDHEEVPAHLTEALNEGLARAIPRIAHLPGAAGFAGLAERTRQVLRAGYLESRAEGLTDLEMAIQESAAS